MAYIGHIKVKNGATEVTYPVGSTLYGTCNTAANETVKVANTGNLAQIDSFTDGLTIHVKFTNSNTVQNPTLKVNTLAAKPIITYGESTPGDTPSASWQAGAIVSFTYDGNSWVMNTGVDLNSASSVISGLNATITGMAANKTLKTLGETNGVINATFEDIEITESQVTNLTAHLNEKAKIDGPTFTGTPQLTTTPTTGDSSHAIADTAFVMTAIGNVLGANDAMVYKGLLDSDATETATTKKNVPASGYSAGWAYRVNRAGTYAGQPCEVGDLVIAIADAGTNQNEVVNNHWTVAQNNIDGAVTGPVSSTDAHVAIFDGTNGKVIKDSGFTIGVSVPADAKFTDTRDNAFATITPANAANTAVAAVTGNTTKVLASSYNSGLTFAGGNKWLTIAGDNSAKKITIGHSLSGVTAGDSTGGASPTFGGSFNIPKITVDAAGHITVLTTASITMPSIAWGDISGLIPIAGTDTLGLVKTTSDVSNTTGLTAAPIINGIVYNSHYTASLIVGASATATTSAATTNTATYLNLIENNAVNSSLQLIGDATISVKHAVASSQNGTPTLTISAAKFSNTTSGYLEAPGANKTTKFLRGDAKWYTLGIDTTSKANAVTAVTLTGGTAGVATTAAVASGILTITIGTDTTFRTLTVTDSTQFLTNASITMDE